jgi:YD repeat-containing protein
MAGRINLIRYPGGALVRRKYLDSAIHDELVDAGGELLMQRSSAWNLNGEMAWMQEGDGERHVWRYDPLGQLVTVEMGGSAWSWSLDAIQGPNRELVILDMDGQVSEAFPPKGMPAWGVSERVLAVFRDTNGRMVKLRGDIGDASLRYDPVGRLQSVVLAQGYWRVRYDAMGRVHRLISPAGKTRQVLWSPENVGGSGLQLPLATGIELSRKWVGGPLGMAAMSTNGQINGVVNLEDGRPLWLLDAEGRPLALATTPMGFPDSAPLGILGPFGTIQLFAGGPLLRNGQALDPLSGHPVTGLSRWPWLAREVVYSGENDWLDPSGWMPKDPWSDPVGLLMDLGLVDLGASEGWTRTEATEPAISWLPSSIDAYPPPIGPWPGDLPLSEDPITTAFLLSALPGNKALDPGDPLEVILQDELASEDLPPGLELRILGFPIKEGPAWLAPVNGTQ